MFSRSFGSLVDGEKVVAEVAEVVVAAAVDLTEENINARDFLLFGLID